MKRLSALFFFALLALNSCNLQTYKTTGPASSLRPAAHAPFLIKVRLRGICGSGLALKASGRIESPDPHLNLKFSTGGFGRGYLPPGTYVVSPHRFHRTDRGFVRGTVGFSFALSDKYDERVDDIRRLLRIHPGSGRGSSGCIALEGTDEELSAFRDTLTSLCRTGTVAICVEME